MKRAATAAAIGLGLASGIAACARHDPPPVIRHGHRVLPVTVHGHVFSAEVAGTPAEQAEGLMYRTDLRPDDAMLFWPYPAGGGGPKVANFWMADTPSSLDIVFIRADGTIATIAENAVPLDQSLLSSGEPVGAVLEIPGGRAHALGIAAGDKVSWPKDAMPAGG